MKLSDGKELIFECEVDEVTKQYVLQTLNSYVLSRLQETFVIVNSPAIVCRRKDDSVYVENVVVVGVKMEREDYERLRHFRPHTKEEVKKLDEQAVNAWENAVVKGQIKYLSNREIYFSWEDDIDKELNFFKKESIKPTKIPLSNQTKQTLKESERLRNNSKRSVFFKGSDRVEKRIEALEDKINLIIHRIDSYYEVMSRMQSKQKEIYETISELSLGLDVINKGKEKGK